LAFALAMAAKALSKMATMRCCSGSGGSGILSLDNEPLDNSLNVAPVPRLFNN